METDILQVRFTEEGKKYIRKFVSISYVLIALVFINGGINVYLNIRYLMKAIELNISDGRGIIYLMLLLDVLALASNIYYVRFPILLSKSLETDDELTANRSFNLLFKAGVIFIVVLILSTVITAWHIKKYTMS